MSNSLRRRMESMQEKQKRAEAEQMNELQRRMADITGGEAAEQALYTQGFGFLPVVCLDALLPNQRLEVNTDDPTLCRLLRDTGLGGLFVMLSLNPKQRKCRRSGVLVRVALCDALRQLDGVPTAVRATLVGRRRVRIVGPAEDLTLRIGRFRRGYDDYTSDPALGWGRERFVDRPSAPEDDEALARAAAAAAAEAAEGAEAAEAAAGTPPRAAHHSEWNPTRFVVLAEEGEEKGEAAVDADKAEAAADRLSTSLDVWLGLARDVRTYDNTDVVAAVRTQHGMPGLRVDPSALLDNVLDQLGPKPSRQSPTALALWGAALINPLPALGVSPECRGSVLEATCATDRLAIVQRAVDRSIANLQGEVPLL